MCATALDVVAVAQVVAEMAIFRYSEMAAVHHIGFVVRVFGAPAKSTW